MKTIALNPLLSVLSVLKLGGAVVVKRSEPLENCTVMTSDIELHGKSVTQILDAEEVQRRVRELAGDRLEIKAMKCADLHAQQLGEALRGLTIDVEALGEALNSAIWRHPEKPEHGGERKNHPQPRNPKSFRK